MIDISSDHDLPLSIIDEHLNDLGHSLDMEICGHHIKRTVDAVDNYLSNHYDDTGLIYDLLRYVEDLHDHDHINRARGIERNAELAAADTGLKFLQNKLDSLTDRIDDLQHINMCLHTEFKS